MSASMRRRDIAALALTALAAPRIAFAATTADPPQTTPESSIHETIVDRMRRLSIEVRINGQGPFRFLVDTGANGSAISDVLASQLALPIASAGLVHGIAGARAAPSVTARSVQVGSRTKRRMSFSILPARALAADGLLGLEWLNNQRLTFDFDEERLRIEPGLARPGGRIALGVNQSGSVVMDAEVMSGRLSLVRASVGRRPVQAFVDSGSYCTIGNLALLEAAREGAYVSREWGEVEVIGATGDSIWGQFATLRAFRLGGMTFRQLPVVFAPVHTFRFWGVDDQPMILIGMDVLRVFGSVSLDFTNREVAFRPRRS